MSKTSHDIDAEIYNQGPTLFRHVQSRVLQAATLPADAAAASASHLANQAKLNAEIDKLLRDTLPRHSMPIDDLWRLLWTRVAYAGTRAAKATAEVKTMQHVPPFTSLANFRPQDFAFCQDEWKAFKDHWQAQMSDTERKAWLSLAQSAASPTILARHFKKTTALVQKLMLKDYPGLKFSAHPGKMEKYLATAHFLHEANAQGQDALELFTRGERFAAGHPVGHAYVEQVQGLRKVAAAFADLIGPVSARHAMLDLGFNTIKPDRVMTLLFSRLGWLLTLPSDLDDETVMDKYLRPVVLDEVMHRADVLANSLAAKGMQHTHRLLDIWFVKYGQEPEPDFGIEHNLQRKHPGGIAAEYASLTFPPPGITPQEAEQMWPLGPFAPVPITAEGPPKRPRLRQPVHSRDQASIMYWQQYQAGHRANPELYPRKALDNDLKEQALRAIERGVDPGDAILAALYPADDEEA